MTHNAVREFAIRAHGNQKYANGPYVAHLDAVVAVLKEFGHFDSALLDAAYLHDVLEDTDTSLKELLDWFLSEAVELVVTVTDTPGKNRAERHAATYPRIAANPKAVTLKLADRIANVRASAFPGSLLRMYRDEYHAFKAALKGEHHGAMWKELDRLLLPSEIEAVQSHCVDITVGQIEIWTKAEREVCARIAEGYDIEVPGKVIAAAIRNHK